MSYLAGGSPASWELEQKQFFNSRIANLSQRRRLAVLLTVGMIAAIEISNRLSINVFLPDMQGNVGASSDEISWVIILYNVGYLCSIAMASWMTRVIGTRRHLLLSMAIYATGAMGCVLSTGSLARLLTSRLIMGFGGGAFLVRVVILAGLLFPGKTKMAAVTRLYLVLAVFEVPYPVVMGWITDTFHWNYAFLVDFPFLAIGAFLVWKLVPPGLLFRREEGSRVDLWGALLLIASLACLETALSRGEQDLWLQSAWSATALIAAVVLFRCTRSAWGWGCSTLCTCCCPAWAPYARCSADYSSWSRPMASFAISGRRPRPPQSSLRCFSCKAFASGRSSSRPETWSPLMRRSPRSMTFPPPTSSYANWETPLGSPRRRSCSIAG